VSFFGCFFGSELERLASAFFRVYVFEPCFVKGLKAKAVDAHYVSRLMLTGREQNDPEPRIPDA
jgi:hypothetical protein